MNSESGMSFEISIKLLLTTVTFSIIWLPASWKPFSITSLQVLKIVSITFWINKTRIYVAIINCTYYSSAAFSFRFLYLPKDISFVFWIITMGYIMIQMIVQGWRQLLFADVSAMTASFYVIPLSRGTGPVHMCALCQKAHEPNAPYDTISEKQSPNLSLSWLKIWKANISRRKLN